MLPEKQIKAKQVLANLVQCLPTDLPWGARLNEIFVNNGKIGLIKYFGQPSHSLLFVVNQLTGIKVCQFSEDVTYTDPCSFEFTLKDFPGFSDEVSLPIDWNMFSQSQPRYLQLLFNSLVWLEKIQAKQGFDFAQLIVLQYCNDFFRLATPFDLTFDEHVLAIRLKALVNFLHFALQKKFVFSEEVLIVLMRTIIVHLHLILDDRFYCKKHNHGLIQDKNFWKQLSFYLVIR